MKLVLSVYINSEFNHTTKLNLRSHLHAKKQIIVYALSLISFDIHYHDKIN